MRPVITSDRCFLFHGDSADLGTVLPENSVDSIVSDPPAGFSFMGLEWDEDKGGRDEWIKWLAELLAPAFRALKPGGHCLLWAIPRTSHWTATALENAGFEIRDVHHHIFGCVPPETEILTERGWVTYDQLAIGENVVQIDDCGAASLGELQAVSVFPFAGEMERIATRSTEQLLTPGHTVHAYAKRSKWLRVETDTTLTALPADSFVGEDHSGVCGWQLPLAARGAQPRRTLESADIASLYGWVIAEGHFQAGVRAVNLYQNEGAHADEIRALLSRLKIPHSEYKRTRDDYDGTPRDHVQWYIKVGPWAERILNDLDGKKPMPPEWLAWLPDVEASALFEALVSGDGSRNPGETSGAWYQKRPEVRAWFQTLCFRLGYRSTENAKKCAVHWTKSDTTEVQRGQHRRRWASKVPYVGDVWCPTVPTGRWVARYHGNVFVTGNTGFPKSRNISKDIDAKLGRQREVIETVERPAFAKGRGNGTDEHGRPVYLGINGGGTGETVQHEVTAPASDEARAADGVGTALKPAVEHWILARKPIEGTLADNFMAHRTGGLNIDACRIGYDESGPPASVYSGAKGGEAATTTVYGASEKYASKVSEHGRWPSNFSLEHGEACREDACVLGCPVRLLNEQSKSSKADKGAARFFYVAKAPRSEKDAGLDHLTPKTGGEATGREEGSAGTKNPRAGAGRNGGARNFHPTVKSVELMRWLCRLVTPPGGIVLDLFAGSGTTGVAALAEGLSFVGIEQGGKDGEYIPIIEGRLQKALADNPLKAENQ